MRKDLKKLLKAGKHTTATLKTQIEYDKLIKTVTGLIDERFNDFTNDPSIYAELIINTVFVSLATGKGTK